jgi:hypothetical protein
LLLWRQLLRICRGAGTQETLLSKRVPHFHGSSKRFTCVADHVQGSTGPCGSFCLTKSCAGLVAAQQFPFVARNFADAWRRFLRQLEWYGVVSPASYSAA